MRRDPDVSGPLKRIRPVWMVGVQGKGLNIKF
jgi:hypothetical protein